jgi:hypothetical protein
VLLPSSTACTAGPQLFVFVAGHIQKMGQQMRNIGPSADSGLRALCYPNACMSVLSVYFKEPCQVASRLRRPQATA